MQSSAAGPAPPQALPPLTVPLSEIQDLLDLRRGLAELSQKDNEVKERADQANGSAAANRMEHNTEIWAVCV